MASGTKKIELFFRIGELAQKAEVGHGTIYFYESIKIFVPTKREGNGNRYYNDRDLQKLKTIILLRDLGYSLKDIKNIVKFFSSPSEIKAAARIKMKEAFISQIKLKMINLKKIEKMLEKGVF